MSNAHPPAEGERTLAVMSTSSGVEVAMAEPRDHYLVIVEGWGAGRRLKLERPLRIGRQQDCGLVMPDSQVSARHCELSLQSMGVDLRIEDLGSTNGTFVEGKRIERFASLPPGGVMRVGKQVLRHEHLSRTEAARAEEHQRGLDKARHYVEALLPAPMTQGPVRTDWSYVPSTHLGGDAFGYHQLTEHTFAGYVMDVSGHGVGAAMHSVSVMNVMRQRALPGCDFHDPADVLRSLNAMFQMELHDGMYFTVWYGVYDARTRTLRYASAGHHASYLVAVDRSSFSALRTRNLVIGAMPQAQFTASAVGVPPDSTLYVFSDGVFEVRDAQGAQLGLDDFLPLLRQPAAPEGGEAARLLAAVRARARPGGFEDDFTLLAVTFMS